MKKYEVPSMKISHFSVELITTGDATPTPVVLNASAGLNALGTNTYNFVTDSAYSANSVITSRSFKNAIELN